MLKTFLMVGVAASVMGAFTARAADPACDRACLEGFMNQYLDAMVAHDPSHLSVSPTVKFTEDDVVLKLGDGLWATASGRGAYKEYFDDPEEGQVAFFGTMKENGHGIALALRLKIENRRISEAESVVVRSRSGYRVRSSPPSPISISKRSSRAMVRSLPSMPTAIASRTE